MITLLEIVTRSAAYLAQKGIEPARREAEEVIADALGIKRIDLYLQFDRPLTDQELGPLRSAIQRRGQHEPTAYIAGQLSFAGIDLKVNRNVLIPRPETEILVEKIAESLLRESLQGKVLWDLCCGSGCIGLSLKKRFPELTVILSDIDPSALQTARTNASVDVSYLEGDLFLPFSGQQCDYLVCNPPYVSEKEFTQLAPEVRDWEPKKALVSGPTGLEFYARIAESLAKHLRPQGQAWLEIGTGQGNAVKALFEQKGFSCSVSQDWAGHDRFCVIKTDS